MNLGAFDETSVAIDHQHEALLIRALVAREKGTSHKICLVVDFHQVAPRAWS